MATGLLFLVEKQLKIAVPKGAIYEETKGNRMDKFNVLIIRFGGVKCVKKD